MEMVPTHNDSTAPRQEPMDGLAQLFLLSLLLVALLLALVGVIIQLTLPWWAALPIWVLVGIAVLLALLIWVTNGPIGGWLARRSQAGRRHNSSAC